MIKIITYIISFFLLISYSCSKNEINESKSAAITKDSFHKVNNDTIITKRINSDKILKNAEIVISKSKRTLSIFADSELTGLYKVVLGFDPVSDKKIEGDGATPEGEFYVCFKNPHSKFHLSLLISYPNLEDAERGLNDSLINKNEYDKIVNAIKQKRTPPQNTQLGGNICIHGGGLIGGDWTAGCIALENSDIEDIFRVIPIGTRVRIEK